MRKSLGTNDNGKGDRGIDEMDEIIDCQAPRTPGRGKEGLAGFIAFHPEIKIISLSLPSPFISSSPLKGACGTMHHSWNMEALS